MSKEELRAQIELVNNPDNDEDHDTIMEAAGNVLRASPALLAEVDALRAENSRLLEAGNQLAATVSHSYECSEHAGGPCDCGFDAALAAWHEAVHPT